VTDPNTFHIKVEDGRSVTNVDISPFILNLPEGTDTKSFSTEDASGSMSMAACVIEVG
jgi:predicted ABC-class ATPase